MSATYRSKNSALLVELPGALVPFGADAAQSDPLKNPLPLARAGELSERQKHIVETHSEAVKRIRDWVKFCDRDARGNNGSQNNSSPQGSELHALAVPPKSGSLVGSDLNSVSRTPLEDWRRERGLIDTRRELYDELYGRLSLERGLKLLNAWTTKYAGVTCRNMNEARKVFPSLTATEIGFLPLLEHLPELVRTQSVSYNAIRAMRREDPSWGRYENIKAKDLVFTPGRGEMRIDGLAWWGESTAGLCASCSTSEVNAEDREIVPYKERVSEVLGQLLLLSLESRGLFGLLRQKASDAIVIGVARIQRAAFEHLGRRANPDAGTALVQVSGEKLNRPLIDELYGLDPNERDAHFAVEREFASRIVKATLRHAEGELLSPEETVHLVGLLTDIPRCLLQDKIFEGVVLFNGTSVLFADSKGMIVEQCQLDPECFQLLKYAVLDQLHESSDKNRAMRQIEDQLEMHLAGKILRPIISGEIKDLERHCSIIEEKVIKLHRDYGVSLQALGERIISTFGSSRDEPANEIGTHISGGEVVRVKMKFGHEEASLICELIERLGKKGIREPLEIFKEQVSLHDFDGKRILSCGQMSDVTLAVKADGTRALCIQELDIGYFPYLGPGGRGERAFLVLFELAKDLYKLLPSEDKAFFADVRRAAFEAPDALRQALSEAKSTEELVVIAGQALRREDKPVRENFAHPLGMAATGDDFAATFAAYLIALPDLEAQAQKSAALSEKLKRIRNFAQGLGIDENRLRPGLFRLGELQNGAKAEMRFFPDVYDEEDIKKADQKMDQIEEGQAASLTVSKHSRGPITREEHDLLEEHNFRVRYLASGLADFFEVGHKSRSVREISDRLLSAAPDGDEGRIREELERIINGEHYTKLIDRKLNSDFDTEEELIDGIIDHLIDAGLIKER